MCRPLPPFLPRALLGAVVPALALPLAVAGWFDPLAASAAQPAAAGCQPVTASAAGDLFDGELPNLLDRDRVPGAVVSVVSGGATVFSTGYGTAEVEREVAFSPATSLVRIASITKLFTWTAVMQQAEAGRLDLDADVNQYLSTFEIPATYPEPVTLRTLLNHTAGFEDRIIGTAARTAEEVPPLGDYLAENLPARLRPPGEVSAYSNFGAALAGHIVAEVSGEPYEEYVQRHILDPLGMRHSTAAEPVPAALAGNLAASYDSDVMPPKRVPFQFDKLGPDGSISATADDLAKFMAAHLDQTGGGILASDTMAAMHQRSFAADPRLDGYAHGFKERTMSGHRILMHDGGWEGFLSGLLLVPDCDLGVFISVNGTSGGEALTEMVDTFFDRFVKEPEPPAPPAEPASEVSTAPAEPVAGFYTPTRRNLSTIERLLTLLGPRRLTIDGDGTVNFQGQQWQPAGGGVYRQVDGEQRLSFRSGSDNRRYVITDGPSFELLGRTESPPVNLVVLLAFLVAGVSALAVPIAGGWRRLRRRQPPRRTVTTPTWRRARSLAAGAALLGLAFLGAIMITLFGDTGDFIYGAPLSFRILLAVPLVVGALGGAALASTVAGWRSSGASLLTRIHQVWLLTGTAALGWFVWQWNLIGWWSV